MTNSEIVHKLLAHLNEATRLVEVDAEESIIEKELKECVWLAGELVPAKEEDDGGK